MVLNNMKSLLRGIKLAIAQARNSNAEISPTVELMSTKDSVINEIYVNSTYEPLTYISNIITSYTQSLTYGYTFVGFGTDSTPVTAGDYLLGDLITTGLSVKTSVVESFEVNEEKTKSVRINVQSIMVTNTSTSDITIAEVGFFTRIYYTSSNSANVMLHREVLDSPITLAPNETKTLTFTFTFENSIV